MIDKNRTILINEGASDASFAVIETGEAMTARLTEVLRYVERLRTDGLLPGLGVALLRAANAAVLRDSPLARALEGPFRQVLVNAEIDEERTRDEVLAASDWMGFDPEEEALVDLRNTEWTVPTKSVLRAIERACELTASLLTGHALEKPNAQPEASQLS